MDISMCLNNTCPLKDSCYRFTAKASERQSYSNFQYEITENEEGTEKLVKCKFYWDNKEYKNDT